MAASVSKGWVINIGYDIDKVIPEDKRWSADIGNLSPDDKRCFKKKRWSADDNVIPEDKRWIADTNEILEEKRWNFEQEIRDAFNASLKRSFPELKEEALLYDSQLGIPGDFNCQNVLTIWPLLRKSPELREKYPHIKTSRDIGEVIKKNLPAYVSDMMDEEPSVEDVGFVTLSLSREWLAKNIHKMLKYGIDIWAPKLPVETVFLHFPSLDGLDYVGYFRQHFISGALIRMFEFSKVSAVPKQVPSMEVDLSLKNWGEDIFRRLFSIKNIGDEGNVVIDGEGTLPFILTEREFQKSFLDLRDLRSEIEEEKPDWIVYITPVWQQEYVEMCFTAAKLEEWIKTDMKEKWNPSRKNEYPALTYAGYRTCNTEHEELANLLEQVRDRCEEVAQGDDAQILGYTAEAVFHCVLMYTCLKTHRLADCTFSFAEMVEEEGNTFIYLLHCLAEIHRVTNDSRKDIDVLKNASELIFEKYEEWEEGDERMLEFHLLEFPEVLEESCLSLLPHMMCKYLYDLTKKYQRYSDFVRKAGPVAETSRLLLCEATAVVMEKCFQVLWITPDIEYLYQPKLLNLLHCTKPPFDVSAPMPDRKKQKMAEIEQKAKTPLDLGIVDRFITPFVSGARDPVRNSRFEVFSIRPFITDSSFENGNLFGLISVSDKYGLRSNGGCHLFEPDFPYVSLFNFEWSDPINIRHAQVVYLDNPSCHSVPFSSSMKIHTELYVTTESRTDCFQLCKRRNKKMDLKSFWREKSYSKCGRLNVKGEDGRTMVHYILLKDAVDVAVEVTFKADPNRKVYGSIFAFYGGEFSYDCHRDTQDCYMALLFRSFLTVGQLPLKRSILAVPKNASLKIKAHLADVDTNEVILSGCYEFLQGRSNGILPGFDWADCSLDLKVVWKY